jgi:ribulose-5-phosphate 4-epimerase/fuculose-1-phosphate aldolase
VHFAMLKASDMVHIDEDGNVIGGNRVAVNKAGFQIHGAIHKARPDINAACHTHSPAGKAWSTFGRPLDIISQDTCAFLGIQAVYENFGGIVLEDEEGQRIAEALGEKNRVVILQNHGILTTGQTVDEAAYLFTLLERSCEVQIMVESTGLPKKVIGKEEAEYTAKIYQEPVSSELSIYTPIAKKRRTKPSRTHYISSFSLILTLRLASPMGNLLLALDVYFYLCHIVVNVNVNSKLS